MKKIILYSLFIGIAGVFATGMVYVFVFGESIDQYYISQGQDVIQYTSVSINIIKKISFDKVIIFAALFIMAFAATLIPNKIANLITGLVVNVCALFAIMMSINALSLSDASPVASSTVMLLVFSIFFIMFFSAAESIRLFIKNGPNGGKPIIKKPTPAKVQEEKPKPKPEPVKQEVKVEPAKPVMVKKEQPKQPEPKVEEKKAEPEKPKEEPIKVAPVEEKPTVEETAHEAFVSIEEQEKPLVVEPPKTDKEPEEEIERMPASKGNIRFFQSNILMADLNGTYIIPSKNKLGIDWTKFEQGAVVYYEKTKQQGVVLGINKNYTVDVGFIINGKKTIMAIKTDELSFPNK